MALVFARISKPPIPALKSANRARRLSPHLCGHRQDRPGPFEDCHFLFGLRFGRHGILSTGVTRRDQGVNPGGTDDQDSASSIPEQRIGAALRLARETAGIGLREMARRLNYGSNSALSEYE